MPGIKPASTTELPATLTNKPNARVNKCYLYNVYMYMKPFRSAEWRKCYLRAGNRPSKNQSVQVEISIAQSIQLDFLRSLGSTTSNEANKSAMLRSEWTITTRQAVLRLAQMKYRYFVPERCKQNAIFSDTFHQNRSYLDNISTNQRCVVGF